MADGVALAAHDALARGEQCELLTVASEPPRDAAAVRVADTIVVTAQVTATYVYKVSMEPEAATP